MVAAVFLMLGLGVWLVDSAVRGRSPITALKELISSGDLSAINDTVHSLGETRIGKSDSKFVDNLSKSPVPSGDVTDWVNEAAAILAQNGRPLSEADKAALIKYYIPNESSGNPHAQNNWDINAKNGIPSKGLMQTIDPTFNAHALPGHTDIWNPVDNIIAAVRYIDGRYGGIMNTPGMISIANGGKWKGY